MVQQIQRSFTSGEIAPSLRSRADMVKYTTGLALCENFFVRAQGGVYSRPGTRFIGEQADHTKKGRLIPFSFNTEQTYILVFEHLKMRVIRDGGFVLAGGGPALFELATPYTEAQLPYLGFTQDADVMTIVHPDHDPRNLSRLADNNWSLTVNNYAPTVTPPTFAGSLVFAIIGITNANPAVVKISVPTTSIETGDTISITNAGGMAEVNNRYFRVTKIAGDEYSLDGEDSTSYGTYTSGGAVSLAQSATTVGDGAGDYQKTYQYVVTAVVNGVESLPSSPVVIITNSLSTTAGVRLEWNAVPNAEYYRVYKDPSVNTDVYGWIGNSNTTSFDDYNIAPIVSDGPPSDRQPFSGAGNKPSAVTYYQQRQIFANTYNEPQTVFTTQTANFNSFRMSNPVRDDDAVTFAIRARQVDEIRHLVSIDSLIMLTSGGEWKLTEGQDQVLTPSTIGARLQSRNGSSWVPPVIINSTVLYLQEKGARIRDFAYDFSSDKYTGNDLSLMSEHLFDGYTIVSMDYATEPYSILWCVRNDGVLLGLTYQREHQVYGWHKHTTDGSFESVAVISENGRDALYAIVKRTINGVDKRYVERLESRLIDNPENAFCVDSGISYSGAPATLLSGLNHLEGKTVKVLADGYVMQDKIVTGGQITLDRPASKVHVGLAYTPVIETLDLDVTATTETIKAQQKSVNRVVIEVEGSRGGWVGPTDTTSLDPMLEIKPRFDSDGYGPISLKTYKQEIMIQPTWGRGGGVRIEQRSPLPLAILSVIPRFDVSD